MPDEPGITQIAVEGFKSLNERQSIEIRPLTILAGANSSGKSSIMQPLLLLKQTLEAPYDPGALKLDGPLVTFTSSEQMLSRTGQQEQANHFSIEVGGLPETAVLLRFNSRERGFDIEQTSFQKNEKSRNLRLEMSEDEILAQFPRFPYKRGLHIQRQRCFLIAATNFIPDPKINDAIELVPMPFGSWTLTKAPYIQEYILNMIYLPGLRGNPERFYPVTFVEGRMPGPFTNYTASVISQWQHNKDENLRHLARDLQRLKLASDVAAHFINDTQVELKVSRLPGNGHKAIDDFVSVADVGLGVSQTLPILVALRVAQPGQLVYIEQPELHLHPRAQTTMAEILANAAKRGVRVVIETHSSLLLLGLQTLVAEGKFAPDLVKLHWFQRGKNGATKIRSADVDNAGAFGDWPEDFAEVELEAQSRYMNAVDRQREESRRVASEQKVAGY